MRKRVIDFQVSISGQDTIIERVTYDQDIPDGFKHSPSQEMREVMRQAHNALENKIGHSDFEVNYWWWIE